MRRTASRAHSMAQNIDLGYSR